jgi:hypothetical protein
MQPSERLPLKASDGRILYVEDDEDPRNFVTCVLAMNENCRVTFNCAEGAKRGWSLVNHNRFRRLVRISRLQLFQEFMNLYLGCCPRLLHFAPLALRPMSFHTQYKETHHPFSLPSTGFVQKVFQALVRVSGRPIVAQRFIAGTGAYVILSP